jgi:hypothetical protein
MNCTDVREKLSGLVYEDLPPTEAAQLKFHLAMCSGCRAEHAALEGVRRLLDQVPAPEIPIDLPRLYAQAAGGEERRMRRWRRTAVALVGVAAALLIVVGLRLEVHREARQIVVRWGDSYQLPDNSNPAPKDPATVPADRDSKEPPVSRQEIQVLRELIHGMASEVETLQTRFDTSDRRQRDAIVLLQERLRTLQSLMQKQWTETKSSVAALYTAQYGSTEKGAKQ